MKLKKIMSLVLAVGLVIGSVIGCGSSTTNQSSAGEAAASSSAETTAQVENTGETYELKMAIAAQDQYLMETFQEKVTELTNGQVTITQVDLTSLGTAADALSMVKNGTIDMLFNAAAQTASDFPVSDVVQLPFYFNSAEKTAEALYALYDAGYLTEFDDNIVPILFAPTDPQLFAFADTKVEDIAQLNGMKIRAVSGSSIALLEALGGSVVSMGFSDVYLSLDRGVIDAAMSSPLLMDTNAIYDVVDYVLNLPVFNGGLFTVVNQAKFESLPTDIQDALKEAGKQQSDEIVANVATTEASSRENMEANGVEFYEASEQFEADLKAASEPMVDNFITSMNEQGYDGQAIIDLCNEIIAK